MICRPQHAVYGGAFDPPTFGHINLILRASRLFDVLSVGVGHNFNKVSMFTAQERMHLLRESLQDCDNVRICSYDGLLVDFCRSQGAQVIIRGLRAIGDFEYEFQMGLANKDLAPEIETLFLIAAVDKLFLSSSVVKEIARCGRDIRQYVPACVADAVEAKIAKR
ncbi:MAG: pantetheine-phosphate adenylyltransferase [Bradymonadia bacterium]|jgi:pantetheine-phosphate adenylyltransferase